MFNSVLIATNTLGIFQYQYESEYGSSTYEGYGDYTTSSIITALFTGAGLVFGGLGMWISKSPVPLGAGAFVGFCSGMWANTYMTLRIFDVPLSLLGIGTVAMGILTVYATIDIMTMQGE